MENDSEETVSEMQQIADNLSDIDFNLEQIKDKCLYGRDLDTKEIESKLGGIGCALWVIAVALVAIALSCWLAPWQVESIRESAIQKITEDRQAKYNNINEDELLETNEAGDFDYSGKDDDEFLLIKRYETAKGNWIEVENGKVIDASKPELIGKHENDFDTDIFKLVSSPSKDSGKLEDKTAQSYERGAPQAEKAKAEDYQ